MSHFVTNDNVKLRAPAFVKCIRCEEILEGHNIYDVLRKARRDNWTVDEYGGVYCKVCSWDIKDEEAQNGN